MWTGAILAGGHARRLGGLNKAGLILQPGGASVLDRQLTRLRRVVDRTIIIANDAERFSGSGLPVIPDVVRISYRSESRSTLLFPGRHGAMSPCVQPTPAVPPSSCGD